VRTRKTKNRVKLSSDAAHGAQDKTRTCTNVIVHYPLKVACLPISPPGRHCRISHFGCANIEFIFESAKFSDALCRKNDFFLPSALHRGSREVGGRLPQGGLGRLWRPPGGWLRGGAAAGPGGWGAVEAGACRETAVRREPGFRKALLRPGRLGGPCWKELSGGAPGCCCRTAARQEVPHNKKEPSAPMRGERLLMALRAGLPQRTKSISRKR
jgi:hypothetical protein